MKLKEKSICCFFGHRDTPEHVLPILKIEIERLILEKTVTNFLVGGYGNFDMYATSTVNSLKKKYPSIKLIYVTAYLSALENNKEYIAYTYDETVYPDGLELIPQKFAISYRNRWIVIESQYMIAYVYHSWGGAYTALSQAKKQNLKIINIMDIYKLLN